MKSLALFSRRSWFLGFGLLLCACADIPQPFRASGEIALPLPVSPSTHGIGVIPVDGMEDALASDLSVRISGALGQRDIPAQSVDRRGRLGYSLEGTLRTTSVSNGLRSVSFDWQLLDRSGNAVERLEQTIQINDGDWVEGSDSALDLIAEDIAAQLAALVAPSLEIATPRASPWQGLTITVQPPREAPGDGVTALSRTLANRLAQQGFEPAPDKPDFFIAGTVSVSRYDAFQDDIAIIWQVLNTDGDDMGEVRLDNRVPRGELDGPWGMIAEAVIDSALPGILNIIATALPADTP